MSFAKKYNKGNVVFDIDIKDFPFINGAEFLERYGCADVKIDGLYINKKGKFEPHPVAIICEKRILVDMPSHMTETVTDILNDAESIDLIKKGRVGITASEYTDKKFGKKCVGFEWVDM